MIKLGQKARDTVSGFTGTVVARTEWLNGCVRIAIQPKVDKDGKMVDNAEFDEPQVEVVVEEPIGRGPSDTGGPLPFKPSRNETPRR